MKPGTALGLDSVAMLPPLVIKLEKVANEQTYEWRNLARLVGGGGGGGGGGQRT
jgi:hypothetical protein